MFFESIRDPTRQEWFPQLPRERDGPVEDWMRPYYPREVFVDADESPLNHWGMGLGGMYCVSAKVKTLIEQLESGVHQFLDVELRRGRDKKYPYHFLKFGRSFDCVDLEKSVVEWRERSYSGKIVRGWMPRPLHPLVVRSDLCRDAHLWQTATPPDLKFMSDKLYDLLSVYEALTGLDCEQQQEI